MNYISFIFLNLSVFSVPFIDFTNLSIKNINDTTNRLRRKYETFFPYVIAHDSGEISIILANSCGGIVCGYLTVSGLGIYYCNDHKDS